MATLNHDLAAAAKEDAFESSFLSISMTTKKATPHLDEAHHRCSKAALPALFGGARAFTDKGEKFLQRYHNKGYSEEAPLASAARKTQLAKIADATGCRFLSDPDTPLNCTELGLVSMGLYCTEDDDDEPDAILIKDWLFGRPYLAVEGNSCIFLIKNKNIQVRTPQDIQLQLFNTGTGNYEDISEEELKVLMDADGVSKKNLAVIFDTPIIEDIPHHVSEETLLKENAVGLFYHEKQTESYCTLHAANSFYGKGIVRPSEVAEYMASYFEDHQMYGVRVQNVERGQEEDLESAASALGRVDGGVDLALVVNYLASLSHKEIIDSQYQHTTLFDMQLDHDQILLTRGDDAPWTIDTSFFEQRDRFMLGTIRQPHTTAFRKKTDGNWVKVDSFNAIQSVIGTDEEMETYLKEILKREKTTLKLVCLYEPT